MFLSCLSKMTLSVNQYLVKIFLDLKQKKPNKSNQHLKKNN